VREHLDELSAWKNMSDHDRVAYVIALVAPFEATEEEIADLIHSVGLKTDDREGQQ